VVMVCSVLGLVVLGCSVLGLVPYSLFGGHELSPCCTPCSGDQLKAAHTIARVPPSEATHHHDFTWPAASEYRH
jgi:hypothetical protein